MMVRWLGTTLLAWCVLTGAVRAADPRTFDDANLYAVQFLDEFEGWAVGDLGTIWHTMDGGIVWERQASGTRATLTTLHVENFRLAWVGGRENTPFNPGSTGVLLWTRDGGGKWIVASQEFLSGIRALRFLDEDHGWVIGESTDQHPSGIFQTTNGARSWNVVKRGRFVGWNAILANNANHLLLGGDDRQLVNLRDGAALPVKSDWRPGSSVRALSASSGMIWAVGDQAQVFQSPDEGRTWKRVNLPIPDEIKSVWNFHAVHALGQDVWITGRPGSLVLHSPDGGARWELQKTGQHLPLHAIQFVNPKQGWAVGAMGTILQTADGGASWKTQRRGGGRASIAWMTHDGRRVPLSAVARLGGEEGYHNIVFAVTSPDPRSDGADAALRPARLNDAVRAVGGTAVDQCRRFPLADQRANDNFDALLATWNTLYEGQAVGEMERDLVLALRMWQPDVVVTDPVEPGPAHPMAATLVAMGVKRAYETAADAKNFPEQLQFFGMEPHAVKKHYAHLPQVAAGAVVLQANDLSYRLQETYGDAALTALGKLHPHPVPVERHAAFQLLDSRLAGAVSHRSLMQGTGVAADGVARRQLEPLDEVAANAAENLNAQKNLRALIEQADQPNTVLLPEQMLAHLGKSAEKMPFLAAGNMVFLLGRKYIESGRWDLAQGALEYLVRTYPKHPLALESLRWLIAYQVSTEARMRAAKLAVVQNQRVRTVKPQDGDRTQLETSTATSVLQDGSQGQRRDQQVVAYGNVLRVVSANSWADPRVQLCIATANRRLGNVDAMMLQYKTILENDPQTPWSSAIGQEQWLFDGKGNPPRSFAWSTLTTEKPYLDGKLQEPCWNVGKRLRLSSGNDERDLPFASVVTLRHDEEYLYLSAQCNYPDKSHRLEPVARKGYDADVDHTDRLEIFIDVDRDYNSYYRLRVDQRGLVADDCWGDPSWNPRWFVATDRDDQGWMVEAAIPLAELTDAKTLTGQLWAFNVVRQIPGRAPMAWTLPAGSTVRPEGLSVLKFLKTSAPTRTLDAPRAD